MLYGCVRRRFSCAETLVSVMAIHTPGRYFQKPGIWIRVFGNMPRFPGIILGKKSCSQTRPCEEKQVYLVEVITKTKISYALRFYRDMRFLPFFFFFSWSDEKLELLRPLEGPSGNCQQRWYIAREPRACSRKKFGRMRKDLWKSPHICKLN